MFTFSVFDHIFFGQIWSKIQNCLFKVELIQRLIRIFKIRWWFHFICFGLKTVTLLGQIWSKNRNCQFKQKIRILRIQ